MKTFVSLLISALILSAMPALAFIVGWGIPSRMDTLLMEGLGKSLREDSTLDQSAVETFLSSNNLATLCWNSEMRAKLEISSVCDTASSLGNLKIFSALAGALSILALFGIFATGKLCKRNRTLLLIAFRPGLGAVKLASIVFLCANAVFLIASLYYVESFWIGKVHVGLIGMVGLVTAVVTFEIAKSMLLPTPKAEARVFGKLVQRHTNPQLWSFVEAVSKDAGATPPDNMVVGLDPNFFVTEAKVRCLDGELTGRTLYFSLPLSRVMSKGELAAILGHETAHFVGNDTKYSKWFYPVYRGAVETYSIMHVDETDHGIHSLVLLTSRTLVSAFLNVFAEAESGLSREREIQADALGARVGGRENMINALVKVHALTVAWDFTVDKMREAIREGKMLNNASQYFAKAVRAVSSATFMNGLPERQVAHPTDSHPPLAVRLEALGSSIEKAKDAGIDFKSDQEYLSGLEELERELSDLEHVKLARTEGITPPTDAEKAPATHTA